MAERLWAKSWDGAGNPPEHVLLPGHLRDVYVSAARVLDETAEEQLAALGLKPGEHGERLRRVVLFASALHDLGKANDHFQGMITGRRDVREHPQGLRHEWATLLMMATLREWLLPAVGDDVNFAIAEWVIAGHHPSPENESPPKSGRDGSGTEIVLHLGHADFLESLQQIQSWFALADPPPLADVRRSLVGNDSLFGDMARWSRQSQRTWDSLKRPERAFVAAAKNCVIAADIAGSALPKVVANRTDRGDWITSALRTKPEPGDLQSVAEHRLNGQSPRAFQRVVAASPGRVTYVRAGCGSGKTLAAYLWAAANHPTRRLYFCYPTTGTATEGFRDYLFDDAENTPRVGAKLFHSRRDIDFEIILNTGRDLERGEADAAARLESLEAWSTPVVACTVDTVLGLIQNNRRGLFAWPALAQSAFVFDEIHAFDDRLFGALLRFLRDLPGLPVLLMTASLPAAREEALRSLLESQSQTWSPIGGPRDLEERPRYRQQLNSDPLAAVRDTIASGGKVLWVCNTVNRVIDAAAGVSNLSPLLYHSRFKYADRVERHKAVIAAFRESGPALAICSQVAEMSLDLSADLLVTDLAPVPALIQRLGRLNRRAAAGDPTKPLVVIEPDKALPYATAQLDAARTWLTRLAADGISQLDLARAWEQTGDQPPELIGSAWLDGGPKTTVCELREGSQGITVLMREDVDRARTRPRDLPRFVLPMPPPRGFDWRSWPRERCLPIAPVGSIDYDPLRGARWEK